MVPASQGTLAQNQALDGLGTQCCRQIDGALTGRDAGARVDHRRRRRLGCEASCSCPVRAAAAKLVRHLGSSQLSDHLQVGQTESDHGTSLVSAPGGGCQVVCLLSCAFWTQSRVCALATCFLQLGSVTSNIRIDIDLFVFSK